MRKVHSQNERAKKGDFSMIQTITRYNQDGEQVYSRVTEFKGRFHDDGYALYAHGNTISRRKNAPLPEGLSKGDLANCYLLAEHLLLNSNALGYRTKKGNKPMNLARIGEVVGIQERQAYRFYKRMEALRMIAKVEAPIMGGFETQYIMNPLYFFNGKTISDFLYWTFHEQLDEHLSLWIRNEYAKRRVEGG